MIYRLHETGVVRATANGLSRRLGDLIRGASCRTSQPRRLQDLRSGVRSSARDERIARGRDPPIVDTVRATGREPLKGVLFGYPYPIVWLLGAEDRFDFLPWEAEADAWMAAAMTATPTRLADLKRIIEDMRLYLRKMHGRDRSSMQLG